VLAEAQGSDYVIWVVAALLYVWDAAKLLSPRQLLLVECGRRHLSAAFSESPFTITGRVLAFSPLLLPHRGVFVAPWGQPWADPTVLAATLKSVEELRGSLLVMRVLATWAFVLLFVIGPVLTLLAGPNAAVVYTAVAVYWTALVAILVLWWQRRDLRLTKSRAAWVSVDVLICPAFLPNLVRKISATEAIEVDGAQLLFATATPEAKEQFVTHLESLTEGFIEEEGAVSDEPGLDEIRSYVAAVRAAQ
jgi:hypothetical protein